AAEVAGEIVSRTQSVTLFEWMSQEETAGVGSRYGLVGGSLASLRSDGGFTAASCLASGLGAAEWLDTRYAPPGGTGAYVLVRARNSCGTGTHGDSTLDPDPRDVLDAASPCP